MAKKDIKTAMSELKKNYNRALTEAVAFATEEAGKDIKEKAQSCLREYCENYTPSSYDRTGSLGYAFVPYNNIKKNQTHIVSTIGIKYDANLLEAYAGSAYNASKKYDGRVDASWVIDNYLEGIHPTTNGSSIPDEVVYKPIRDAESPTQKMDKFLTKYNKSFEDNVYAYLASYLLK